jgi:hypothetical protein
MGHSLLGFIVRLVLWIILLGQVKEGLGPHLVVLFCGICLVAIASFSSFVRQYHFRQRK